MWTDTQGGGGVVYEANGAAVSCWLDTSFSHSECLVTAKTSQLHIAD
jgi:hypothetical protein